MQVVQEHGSKPIDVIPLVIESNFGRYWTWRYLYSSMCHVPPCVITSTGFGYQFNALTGENDELANAYDVIFTTARQLALRTIFETWIPLLRKISGLSFPSLINSSLWQGC